MMGLLDPRLMQYLQQLQASGAMNQPGYNRPLPPPGVPGGVGPRPPMPGKPMMPNPMPNPMMPRPMMPRPMMPNQVPSFGSRFVPAQPRMSVDPRSYAMPPRGINYGP